jgi:hypothetical protein
VRSSALANGHRHKQHQFGFAGAFHQQTSLLLFGLIASPTDRRG